MDHVRVLVVDDDAAVRQSLSTALGRDGYEVLAAEGGNAALAHLVAASVDAIVLDVAMPEPNGLEVCRRLRARGDRTPILMLTARDLVDDRVAGLDAGADDYLVKPFALAELRARLRALLRRNAASAERLSYGDLVLDLAAARVTRGGREVSLTRTEYLLLELFLRNPGRVLSHSQIFQAVWGYDFGLRSDNLWVYMGYLRTKLEAAGEPRILHTVRGLGYVLRDTAVTLRNRVSVAAAVGVLIVVAAVSGVLYLFYAASLHSRVDAALVDAAAASLQHRHSASSNRGPATASRRPTSTRRSRSAAWQVQLFPGQVAAGQPTPFGPLDSQRCRGRRAGAAALLCRRARRRPAVPRLHSRLARQPRRAGARQPGRERR